MRFIRVRSRARSLSSFGRLFGVSSHGPSVHEHPKRSRSTCFSCKALQDPQHGCTSPGLEPQLTILQRTSGGWAARTGAAKWPSGMVCIAVPPTAKVALGEETPGLRALASIGSRGVASREEADIVCRTLDSQISWFPPARAPLARPLVAVWARLSRRPPVARPRLGRGSVASRGC